MKVFATTLSSICTFTLLTLLQTSSQAQLMISSPVLIKPYSLYVAPPPTYKVGVTSESTHVAMYKNNTGSTGTFTFVWNVGLVRNGSITINPNGFTINGLAHLAGGTSDPEELMPNDSVEILTESLAQVSADFGPGSYNAAAITASDVRKNGAILQYAYGLVTRPWIVIPAFYF